MGLRTGPRDQSNTEEVRNELIDVKPLHMDFEFFYETRFLNEFFYETGVLVRILLVMTICLKYPRFYFHFLSLLVLQV